MTANLDLRVEAGQLSRLFLVKPLTIPRLGLNPAGA
jgi:hypothetical protein